MRQAFPNALRNGSLSGDDPMTRWHEAPATALLVKPGSMGDVVHALPVAAGLRAAGSHVTWLIDERWAPLVENNPAVSAVVRFPRARFRGPLGLVKGAAWGLRAGLPRCVLCVDLQGLLRSGLLARLARPSRLIGLSDAREGARFLYPEVARVRSDEHSVVRYLRTLDVVGIPRPDPITFPLPPTNVFPNAPTQPYVLLHPFSRGGGKSLAPDVLHALCQALEPLPVVLAGAVDSGLRPRPDVTLDCLGKTSLLELLALIRGAACVVSVDSGPMHLAAAVGVPLIAIHTWSDPRLVGPYHPDAWIWQGGTLRPQDLHAAPFPGCQPDRRAAEAIASRVFALLAANTPPQAHGE